MLAKDDITAILLSWKRPETMQLLVDGLREYGIEHIWVWCQENVKPPRGASVVISSSENLGTWPRYAIAGLAETKYILLCDDDWCLTSTGLDALRAGATIFPGRVLGLSGTLYRYRGAGASISYHHRTYKRSHRVKIPTLVDLTHHIGVLGPRRIFQRMFGEADAWSCLRDSIGFTIGDDWGAMASLRIIGEGPPIIIPTRGRAYRKPTDPAPQFATHRRPNIRKDKHRAFAPLRQLGFRPIETERNFASRVRKADWLFAMTQKMKELEGEL